MSCLQEQYDKWMDDMSEQIAKLEEENERLKKKLQAITCLECEKNLLECEC